MDGKPVIGLGERYRPGEIVVDLEHRPVVEELLRESKFTQVSTYEEIPPLGLALLSVKDIDQAEHKIGDYHDLATALAEEREALHLPTGPSPLDVVLRHLRTEASRRHDGWTPFMGKNREMEPIEGLPHIGVGQDPPEAKGFVAIPRRHAVSGPALRVGILDTRLAPNDKLAGRYVTSDLVDGKQPYRPWQGHATFVAGMILMRAPAVELDVRSVLDDEDGRASSWEVAKKMADFLGSGVQILNLSFGGPTADGMPPLVLERAVSALSAEMLLVAAAGNHGDDGADRRLHADILTPPRTPRSPIWPAAMPNVVAVGATDAQDGVAPFTPRDVPWLDLVAPGVDVVSTFLDGQVQAQDVVRNDAGEPVGVKDLEPVSFSGVAKWSGTSFAAADATGEIARVAHVKQCTVQEALEIVRSREPGGGHSVHRPPWKK